MVVLKRTLTPMKKFQKISTPGIQTIRETEDLDLSSHPVRPVVDLATPQRNATLEQRQLTDRLPGIDGGRTKPSPTEKCSKQLRWECPSYSPDFKQETPRLHSGAAIDRPETNELLKLPPTPEVVWQHPTGTLIDQVNLNINNNDSIIHYTQKQTTVASQTSPPKGTQPQNYVVTTEQPSANQTENELVPFLNCSKNCSANIQNSEQNITTTRNRVTTTPLLTTATPVIEEGLV